MNNNIYKNTNIEVSIKLSRIIKILIDYFIKSENIKHKISNFLENSNNNTSIFSIFSNFDTNKKGYLSPIDITNLLFKNNCKINKKQNIYIKSIISLYSKNSQYSNTYFSLSE